MDQSCVECRQKEVVRFAWNARAPTMLEVISGRRGLSGECEREREREALPPSLGPKWSRRIT